MSNKTELFQALASLGANKKLLIPVNTARFNYVKTVFQTQKFVAPENKLLFTPSPPQVLYALYDPW